MSTFFFNIWKPIWMILIVCFKYSIRFIKILLCLWVLEGVVYIKLNLYYMGYSLNQYWRLLNKNKQIQKINTFPLVISIFYLILSRYLYQSHTKYNNIFCLFQILTYSTWCSMSMATWEAPLFTFYILLSFLLFSLPLWRL